jgi:acyl-CoA synthetase (AMP-forming)/AMP-acid ligase II
MTSGPTAAWPSLALHSERHYDGRVFLCHADRPRNLTTMIAETVARRAADEAIVAGARRLSYSELDRLSGHVAGNLTRHGIGPGDRVALLLCNCPEFVVYLIACLRLGAIAVPLGARLKAPELETALNDCGAAALIYESEYAGNLPAAATLPGLRLRILTDGTAAGAEPGAAFLAPAGSPSHDAREEDTAIILYTSGTTGRPKGAMLTHLGIVHSALNFEACLGLRQSPGERAVLTVPASHVTGLVAVLFTMLRCGGCTVMMRAFKARDFLSLAAAERLTYTIMVPAQYALCLMQPDLDAFDLGSWRIGAFGGAPMPEATIAALARAWPRLVLVNGYGATETTSPTAIMPPGLNTAHPDSVGQIVPGGAVRIVDESGRGVAPGTPGEIWIAGPMVVPGYWRNAVADAAEFTESYWHSGDIGSLDAAGFLRVFDRKKDMINRAGYKVYSAEVENVLLHHPEITEAAVIGSPDPVLGERVKAFVRTRDPGLSAASIRAFCAVRLADYKVPEFIVLTDGPLPRNANGKLQKELLRRRSG